MTPNELITRFRRRYSQCDQATALQLLNDVEEEILFSVPLRKSERWIALSQGVQQYALPESDVRVWNTEVIRSAAQGDRYSLVESTSEAWDNQYPGWRDSSPEWSAEFSVEVRLSGGSAQGQCVLLRPSPASSLIVTGATNASLIVVTTSTNHGLADGDLVLIRGVLGNWAANGRAYAKVTTYSTTTFALFSDASLSIPVAGSGTYVSGGLVMASGRPGLFLEVSERATYTGSETIPVTPLLRDLYVDGMCRLFAKERDKASYGYWETIFTNRLAEQQRMVVSRAVGVYPELQPRARQRTEWR